MVAVKLEVVVHVVYNVITHADGSRMSKAIIRVCLCVILLFVCLFFRTITQKRMIPKCSYLV